jgi:hypothetical protein
MRMYLILFLSSGITYYSPILLVDAKRVQIKDGGRELPDNCDICRPRCNICKITLTGLAALKYHNIMTHPERFDTSFFPSPK